MKLFWKLAKWVNISYGVFLFLIGSLFADRLLIVSGLGFWCFGAYACPYLQKDP